MKTIEKNLMHSSCSGPMTPIPFVIKNVYKDTYDTFTIETNSVNGYNLSFFPGQFNMLYVFGVGEIPISISGSPLEKQVFIHTTRVVGAVTKALSKLKKGDMLGIRGPFGIPWPLHKAYGKDLVIVAGGIGLAPVRPIIYQALSERKKYRKIILLYGTRTPEDILYKKELKEWSSKIEVLTTVDRAISKWKGNVGVVTKLISTVLSDPLNTILMICGPEIMMRFTIQELLNCKIKEKNIFISMERNMKCAIGFCGHCQFGPEFICKDGPVFCYENIKNIFGLREI